MIQLGSTVEDVVTGFRGVVTARSVHLTGCARVWVEPGFDKKQGKLPDGRWIDEPIVKLLKGPSKEIQDRTIARAGTGAEAG